jgi:hypothetical protein
MPDDSRPWADGYDRPWDLLPHRRDGRDDAGYDKPWDLKPHEKDVRVSVAAVGDYDAPWDIKPRSIVERELIAAKTAKDAVVVRGAAAARLPTSSAGIDADRPAASHDVDPILKQLGVAKSSIDPLKDAGVAKLPPPRLVQPNAVSSTSAGRAVSPPAVGEKIDPRLPLNQQSWYHGSISRTDAENLLRVHREGSYLVRTSESNRLDYSLSVKSAKGFMHMKIATELATAAPGSTDGSVPTARYILGQFSQPFSSISQMIHHYTVNKLPIKGAEHMCLLYPISNELL